jgi:methylated-DNA-[protein]-cysteine S-methyltransferase
MDVRFGETASYSEIARAIGEPLAARAVGKANAINPIAIIVPCHRIIGSDGSLTGYGGGLKMKRALLEHEARYGARPGDLFASAGAVEVAQR